MTKQAIIERMVEVINRLPNNKAEEIADFADFVIKRHEDYLLAEGLQHVIASSKTFEFLQEEEDLYSVADIKEKYNG